MEDRFIEPKKDNSIKTFIIIVAFAIIITLAFQYSRYGQQLLSNDGANDSKVALTEDNLCSICPFQMAGLGKVRSISKDDNVITFHFFVTESEDSISIDITAIKKNEERAMDLAMVEVQGTKGRLRELMNKIVQQGMSLCFDIKGDKGGNGQIILTPLQIRDALNRLPFANDYDFSLHAIANTNRMLLPLQVDAITEWVDVEINSNDFIYVYSVDDSQLKLSTIDLQAQKEVMYKKLKENRRDLKNIIEGCANTKRGIIYRYIGKWNRESTGIHIWPEELI